LEGPIHGCVDQQGLSSSYPFTKFVPRAHRVAPDGSGWVFDFSTAIPKSCSVNPKLIRIVFYLTLSITLVTALIMMRQARNFRLKDGHQFTIMNMEMGESQEDLMQLFSTVDADVLESLNNNLKADYFFMFGCYPFVSLLCWLAARTSGKILRHLFFTLAFLQLVPLTFDLIENYSLQQWLHNKEAPVTFGVFQLLVTTKFILALGAFLVSSMLLYYRALPKTSEFIH
jgi:hypothetical protein